MVKRVNLGRAPCPVARALDVIGDWWSLLIIRDAFDGVRRFSEFQTGLGIGKGVLATRLRDLTERGILETAPASDGSAYREYVLTEKGRGLFLVIVALRQWGEDHLYRPDERRSSLVDTETGGPVARLELRSGDGRLLGWNDTQVKKTDRLVVIPNEASKALRSGIHGPATPAVSAVDSGFRQDDERTTRA